MKIKSEKQYNKIINGATTILLTDGLAGFSTLKVSKLIKMSQSNIYVYFKNKEDLLVSTFTYHQKKYIQLLPEDWEGELIPQEVLFKFIQAIYQFSRTSKESLEIIWLIRQSTELRQKIPQVEDDQIFINLFKRLEEWQKKGIVRDFPLLYLANVTFSAVINYIQLIDSQEMTEAELSIEKLVASVSHFLFVE